MEGAVLLEFLQQSKFNLSLQGFNLIFEIVFKLTDGALQISDL